MFDEFLSKFRPDEVIFAKSDRSGLVAVGNTSSQEFLARFAGASFNSGIYRLHSNESIIKWNKIISDAFPAFKERFTCFGYDWLGRQFTLDYQRKSPEGEPLVLMMEPGTGEVLEIPANFLSFHNDELVNYSDAALSESFFNEWLATSGRLLKHNECAGYKIPLFLGGEDEVSNLEVIDIEIYWNICGQLINKTKSLPDHATIKSISIE